jgi:hypothetical protein
MRQQIYFIAICFSFLLNFIVALMGKANYQKVSFGHALRLDRTHVYPRLFEHHMVDTAQADIKVATSVPIYERFHDLPLEVDELLNKEAEESGLPDLLEKLLLSFRAIGSGIRDGEYTSLMIGSQNVFGDQQLDVDLQAEKVGELKADSAVHSRIFHFT